MIVRKEKEVFQDVNLMPWERYFDESFANSPILCERLNATAGWYEVKAVAHQQAICAASEKR